MWVKELMQFMHSHSYTQKLPNCSTRVRHECIMNAIHYNKVFYAIIAAESVKYLFWQWRGKGCLFWAICSLLEEDKPQA